MTKSGLIRNNMLGRRVVRMARSVITCKSDIGIGSVIIPNRTAKTLTVGTRVNKYNFDEM